AVAFLERLSPALEQVDSSSGAIGTAVNRAIDELVPIVAQASVDDETRRGWLERLFEALEADDTPYIEQLGDHWGDLCATAAIASGEADRLIGLTRRVLEPDRRPGEFFPGTSACLSALFKAERYDELVAIAGGEHVFWAYREWAVKALAAQGRKAEALRLAESSRGPWSSDLEIDRLGEEILLSSGMVEEAYARYGLSAHRGGTHLATFRAVAKRYPSKAPKTILEDLASTTPGEEGKWFAAAKSAGLLEEALDLARRSPCDPRTLTRAARDFAVKEPRFAIEAGLLALHWLVAGQGYEITAADVWEAYHATMEAARRQGEVESVETRVRALVQAGSEHGFVSRVLARRLSSDLADGAQPGERAREIVDRAPGGAPDP
ncbi:MAG TPA: hypothetical protein VNB06_05890, partial [Thermoanaerobaculia bacterium]|nr:hypothetical protein [Thermoanaerobaculia bacterium]